MADDDPRRDLLEVAKSAQAIHERARLLLEQAVAHNEMLQAVLDDFDYDDETESDDTSDSV